MPEIILPGCTPEPLMSYLKALGVFRLVAEQADATAKLSWAGGVARLDSTLDRESLSDFFLRRYRPTPIVAPWNGGSGFYGGGEEPLKTIEKSKSDRLELYRTTIASIRNFVPADKPKDEDKTELLVQCRAELPDEMVPWLDVCFVIGEEKASFFPLLGTGGNDGRLDFTNNFMQRVSEVISFKGSGDPPDESLGWLSSALWNDSLTSLGKTAVGQFNPGAIGGANGVQGRFEADSRVNPWDYILMIEGALLFAGAVARRLGAIGGSRAVFPFSVDSVAVGYGSASASEETTDGSRAELWLPLWESGATFAEVRQLFSEGRAQLGRQQARNAVEFSVAVSLLGISRGITSFARYGFLKRNGLAFLAAPIGRFPVTPRPKARLLNDSALTEWVERYLRRACSDKDKTPARYQAALRGIDRAVFGFSNRSEQGEEADEQALSNVLMALGKAERTLAGGLAFCKDKFIRPLAGLHEQWLEQADDGSPEFRLAASLAGMRGVRDTEVGPFRTYLEPVAARGHGLEWNAGSTSAVWSNQPLAANLAAVFRRRHIESFRNGITGVPVRSTRPAPLADVLAFLRDEIDEERLSALIWALPALNWDAIEYKHPQYPPCDELAVPREFGIPRLVVEPVQLAGGDGQWRINHDGFAIVPEAEVLTNLHAGKRRGVEDCVERAAKRLRSSGFPVIGWRNRQQSSRPLAVQSTIEPERLLAAMLFPLSESGLEAVANAVLYPPESEE
jgi:CRISPR-associated protein Csx17